MKFILHWGTIFFLCVFVRLPYLLGSHIYFDGDEAIVGVMAQDLLHGKNLPIYFYGQQYGFALVEVLSTALFLLFLGNGVFALKLGGLLVFSLGITCIKQLMSDWQLKPYTVWLLVLLMSVFPVWFLWAAKVRGGYVTAFTAVCALMYLLGKKRVDWKEIAISACCVAIAIVSHVMLLLPFGALVVYLAWKKISRRQLMGLFLFAASFYFLLKIPATANDAAWYVSANMRWDITAFKTWMFAFPNSFVGYAYYDYLFEIPAMVWVIIVCHIILFIVLFFLSITRGDKNERTALLLGLVGFIGSSLLAFLIDAKAYRYLLGTFTIFAAMYIFIIYKWVAYGRLGRQKTVLVMVIFISPIFHFGKTPAFWQSPATNDMEALKALNHQLVEKGIVGIFCSDALLTWQLNYYGRDRYAARYLFQKDRTPTFIDRVNTCYTDTTCRTAIVGIYGSCLGMDSLPGWHENVIYIGERFYIQPNVSKGYLLNAGFELP